MEGHWVCVCSVQRHWHKYPVGSGWPAGETQCLIVCIAPQKGKISLSLSLIMLCHGNVYTIEIKLQKW